ncbi:hypothetical protein LTR85_007938 [Meristemomyces frigidus]|nr:hypothetical protein LTR85_007938 [Meristemomyces frigidus]
MSRYLNVTDDRDYVFAVLGMCGVLTGSGRNIVKKPEGLAADYNMSMAEIWKQTALYILDQALESKTLEAYSKVLSGYFNFVLQPRHDGYGDGPREAVTSSKPQSLPSWVVDWRTCCVASEVTTICDFYDQHLDKFFNIFPFTAENAFVPRTFEDFPKLSPGADSTLRLHARVQDVIASLSDYICDFDVFTSACPHESDGPRDSYGPYAAYPATPPEPPLPGWTLFDSNKHTRRLALLEGYQRGPVHYGNRIQLAAAHLRFALVPPSARPGDVLLLVAPAVLPLVVGPPHSSPTAQRYAARVEAIDAEAAEAAAAAAAVERCLHTVHLIFDKQRFPYGIKYGDVRRALI